MAKELPKKKHFEEPNGLVLDVENELDDEELDEELKAFEGEEVRDD